jgi:hypothetical protein
MNNRIIEELAAGAQDAFRLSVALLTAPYFISKAFVMRTLGEPFHWTWDNRAGTSTSDARAGN